MDHKMRRLQTKDVELRRCIGCDLSHATRTARYVDISAHLFTDMCAQIARASYDGTSKLRPTHDSRRQTIQYRVDTYCNATRSSSRDFRDFRLTT